MAVDILAFKGITSAGKGDTEGCLNLNVKLNGAVMTGLLRIRSAAGYQQLQCGP